MIHAILLKTTSKRLLKGLRWDKIKIKSKISLVPLILSYIWKLATFKIVQPKCNNNKIEFLSYTTHNVLINQVQIQRKNKYNKIKCNFAHSNTQCPNTRLAAKCLCRWGSIKRSQNSHDMLLYLKCNNLCSKSSNSNLSSKIWQALLRTNLHNLWIWRWL